MLSPEELANSQQAASLCKDMEINCDIPRQLSFGQWALESEWGLHSPGNNPFGLKAAPGQPFQMLRTHEQLTLEQLEIEKSRGLVVLSIGPEDHLGRHNILCMCPFLKFDTLAEAFAVYASKLNNSRWFRPRLIKYRRTHDFQQLLLDLMGADKLPVYTTDSRYNIEIDQILAMPEVVTLLAEGVPPPIKPIT